MQDGSISPVGKFFRSKWVWLIGAIDIIIIIIIVVVAISEAAKTATISFNITPIDATITVNGSGGYKNSGEALDSNNSSGEAYSFAPGTYEIQISHADLDTKTFIVDLEPNSNITITTFLSQDGHFSYYTLKDNYSSFYRLASMASAGNNQTTDHDASAEDFIDDFEKQYGLFTTELPIKYKKSEGFGRELQILMDVTIRADYSCDITLCLEALMVGTDSKDLVKSLLQEKGFNVEDYEINYTIF